ncbi:MAG: hypothetical protein CM15mP45_12730 [Deltaproteobacteria bacterium]|nr:MAG: hypothetical protein CM15mP45_12730 [Deltaproteobacteria bacterium]
MLEVYRSIVYDQLYEFSFSMEMGFNQGIKTS